MTLPPLDKLNMSLTKSRVAIETQGCKLNQADTEALLRHFIDAGFSVVDQDAQADVYIVNACTVSHVADRKARISLRSARRRNPSAVVVATGCYAQRAPNELERMSAIDLVVGNKDKDRLVQMVVALRGDAPVPCATGDNVPIYPGVFGRTRTMIPIQKGCNQICAYCIVPKVRGREKSVSPDILLQQVSQRIQEGFKEVVLTGTQLGSYGFDLMGQNLRALIEKILSDSRVPRLRISSLQPQEISSTLLDLWSDSRLCPHFHMPLQSGSDNVLKNMRRRYTSELYRLTVERIRAKIPDVSITTDVIVGFQGETDQDFQNTIALCRALKFTNMHVFPYSVRVGTSAAYAKNQVSETDKANRMEVMLALDSEMASYSRQKAIGSDRSVLWEYERKVNDRSTVWGLTDNYLKVYTWGDRDLVNQITPASLVQKQGEFLFAEVI